MSYLTQTPETKETKMKDFTTFTTPELIDALGHMNRWLKQANDVRDQYVIDVCVKTIDALQTVLDSRMGAAV